MIEDKANLYDFKDDIVLNNVPDNHVMINDKIKQRKICKKYFEDNVNLWDVYYEGNGNPYKYNLDKVKAILKKCGGKTLLDIGCGSGKTLCDFIKMGFESDGCDFATNAVMETRKKMNRLGINDNVYLIDIEDEYLKKKYDVIVSIGVFPHITDDRNALSNVVKMLNRNGTVIIQFRNELFNLFTFNSYSKTTFKKLIPFNLLSDKLKNDFDVFINQKFSSGSINSEFKILSKFDNPLNIDGLFKSVGLEIKNIYFFHYHVLPPIFQLNNNDEFLTMSEKLEKSNDWRGYFLASSFIVEAKPINPKK